MIRLFAENLAARRGEDLLFSDLSFSLTDGEALIVTGANGSGKSTLLRVVCGLLAPDEGAVRCIIAQGEGAKHISGPVRPAEVSHYLGHRNGMKQELTVEENLAFWKSHLGDQPGGKGMSIEDAARAVGLPSIAHLPYAYLSAGQQRRFAMARLLVAHRPVWVLDEPTAALDKGADRMFEDLVRQHRRTGGIVIAATHDPLGMEDAKTLHMRGFSESYAEQVASAEDYS